jgi:hypothetical protein
MPDQVVTTPPQPVDRTASAARQSAQVRDMLWDVLVDQGSDSAAFCQAWLNLQCSQIADAGNGVLLLRRDDGAHVVAATWPAERLPPNELSRLVERAMSSKRPVIAWGRRRPTPQHPLAVDLLVAQPIGTAEEPMGAVGVTMLVAGGIEAAADPDTIALQLRWGSGWVDSLLWRQRNEVASGTLSRAAVGLDLLAVVSEHRRLKRGATAAVNELAMRLRCDRVSLGLTHRGGARLKAMSHAASF